MPRTEHRQSVAFRTRSGFKLLNALNEKTYKGEKKGYLTALMYLAPHTLAGGRNVCPHSTEACRSACLYGAGRGAFERTRNARIRRTREFFENRSAFMERLAGEIDRMRKVADEAGLRLAIRLNGTSDILWERERWGGHPNLMAAFPDLIWYDYTKIPLRHRAPPRNYHLLFSLADDNIALAASYLRAGHSISAVVPKDHKAQLVGQTLDGVTFIDGDEDDLRFLDQRSSVVLLSPKGRIAGSGLVRTSLLADLASAMRAAA